MNSDVMIFKGPQMSLVESLQLMGKGAYNTEGKLIYLYLATHPNVALSRETLLVVCKFLVRRYTYREKMHITWVLTVTSLQPVRGEKV